MLTLALRSFFLIGVILWYSAGVWRLIDDYFRQEFKSYLDEEIQRNNHIKMGLTQDIDVTMTSGGGADTAFSAAATSSTATTSPSSASRTAISEPLDIKPPSCVNQNVNDKTNDELSKNIIEKEQNNIISFAGTFHQDSTSNLNSNAKINEPAGNKNNDQHKFLENDVNALDLLNGNGGNGDKIDVAIISERDKTTLAQHADELLEDLEENGNYDNVKSFNDDREWVNYWTHKRPSTTNGLSEYCEARKDSEADIVNECVSNGNE